MRHAPAVWIVQLPTHAPLVSPEFWNAARQFDAGLIEVSESALSINGVNCRRQRIDHFAEPPLILAHGFLSNFRCGNIYDRSDPPDDVSSFIPVRYVDGMEMTVSNSCKRHGLLVFSLLAFQDF